MINSCCNASANIISYSLGSNKGGGGQLLKFTLRSILKLKDGDRAIVTGKGPGLQHITNPGAFDSREPV